MDSPDNAGSGIAGRQFLRDVDLHRRDFTAHYQWLANTEPTRFYAMVEALTEGNAALTAALLWRWGVFIAPGGKTALSRGNIRPSTVQEWTDEERLAGYAYTAKLLRDLCNGTTNLGALLPGKSDPTASWADLYGWSDS